MIYVTSLTQHRVRENSWFLSLLDLAHPVFAGTSYHDGRRRVALLPAVFAGILFFVLVLVPRWGPGRESGRPCSLGDRWFVPVSARIGRDNILYVLISLKRSWIPVG